MKPQTSPGLVSIMMPAHNAANYIRAAVDSVRRQTYPDWELIVVDDGSTDGTAETLMALDEPRMSLSRQPAQGEATARNTALDQLNGEFVAFLDADDAWLPDHLERTVRRLGEAPAPGGVYTDGFFIDGHGRQGSRLAARRRGPFAGDLFEELIRSSDVFGPPGCVVLRRAPIVRRGLRFDPTITIGPDWDFLTAYAETETFDYIDHPTLLYRLHEGSISSRTHAPERSRSLARCREKAIGRARFAGCGQPTRAYVFYELLVELLPGEQERRTALLHHPEFERLPAAEKARLLRLMATADLRNNAADIRTAEWLTRAKNLNPTDPRNAVLATAFAVSPNVCRLLLLVADNLRTISSRTAPSPAAAQLMVPAP
jgi:glycosyltransferase involved in cell wall biosynthesis